MSSAFADSEFEETIDSQRTLGTASLLGIFFGFTMVCSIFFGFGYSYGRRSFSQSVAFTAKPPAVAAPSQVSAARIAPAQTIALTVSRTTSTLNTSAPAQLSLAPVALPTLQTNSIAIRKTGAPAPIVLPAVSVPDPSASRQAARTAQPAPTATTARLTTAPTQPSAVFEQLLAKPSAIRPVMEEPTVIVPDAHSEGVSPNALRSPSTPSIYTPPFYVHAHATLPRPMLTTAHGTSHDDSVQTTPAAPHEVLVLQVAAMSRQHDAEVLASSLRKRGFATSIRNDGPDLLYHVQVGPYQRNVALAARQKLLANGYNAVLK